MQNVSDDWYVLHATELCFQFLFLFCFVLCYSFFLFCYLNSSVFDINKFFMLRVMNRLAKNLFARYCLYFSFDGISKNSAFEMVVSAKTRT